jgi:hypothetical protein
MSELPETDERVREVRRCIELVRDRQSYDAASSLRTLRALERLVANILESPDDAKFRKLRVTNPKIALLLAARGVQPFLVAVGWRMAVQQMEEVWLHDDQNKGYDLLPLLATSRRILARLAASDEAAQSEVERARGDTVSKQNAERVLQLAEIRSDHQRRAERFAAANSAAQPSPAVKVKDDGGAAAPAVAANQTQHHADPPRD